MDTIMNEPTWNDREQLAVSRRTELHNDDLTNTEPDTQKGFRWGWLLFIIALLTMFYLGLWANQRTSSPTPITVLPSVTSTQNTPLVVHVAGAVKKPGVYSLPAQARISQAIQKAGGPLPNADVNQLNLADWAKDGVRIDVPEKAKVVVVPTPTPMVVYIEKPTTEYAEPEVSTRITEQSEPEPSRTTTTEKRIVKSREKPKEKKAKPAKTKKPETIAGMPRALTAAGKPSDNASPEFLKKHPLNLNRATAEQLEALPGVGPSLAQKILDYRKEHGGFKSVEKLDDVPGIGPKKLEDITPLVTVE
jgi:competence protein ComEA